MAFETYEVSTQSAQPVELYVLVMGSDIWRMCNSIDSVTWSGDVYTPTIIGRGNIQSGMEAMDIELPSNHPFPYQYATVAPGQTATLTIYRYHRADPSDVKIRYKGVVRTVSYTKQGRGAEIHVIPLTATFDKMIPDRTYQAACNNVLYDSDCKVVRPLFDYVGSVSAVSGSTITVGGLTAAKGATWAEGGYVSHNTADFRLVLSQATDVLTLNLPFYDDVTGTTVHVYAGCDHSAATCASKFSNADNFGGCPYVPTKNIFMTGL
jgi:uncharacterized phage protein (TIGR02218 family)